MHPQPERIRINQITEQVIGAAIAVHRALGPGLLESAYQECLCQELALRGIPFERQVPVVVEVKSIEAIAPIHEAQLLTYLRLGGWSVGLLMNFNVVVLKDGIRRRVLGLRE